MIGLTKSAVITVLDPGTPGTPEIAPTPGTPAWTEVVTIPGGLGIIYWVYVFDQWGRRYASPVYGWIPARTYTIYRAAIPGTPGIAGTPGTAPTISIDAQLGWNASAISIDPFVGTQMFQCSIDRNSVGVVVGLNDASSDSGYSEIDYGIYASSGLYRIIEGGVIKTSFANFATADVFTIVRLGDLISYWLNSTKVYTSATRTAATMIIDCSMYAAYDRII